MHKILKSYQRRLTNLSGNNKSLLLLRLLVEQHIDIHDFNFLENHPSFKIIENLIARKTKTQLCAITDSRDHNSNEVSKRLKRLQRLDNFIFEERGAKDLYLGWPFLRGKFSDDTLVRAPLMFFPVELAEDGKHWNLYLRPEVNITLNKSLLLAYAYFNKVKLEEELIEKIFDDYDTDSTVFRTELYQIFKDSPIEFNFNQENFIDQLISFKSFTKNDFEKNEKTGELKLFPD